MLKDVKHIIVVLSGKGGVGKSSVAVQLALSLYATPSSSLAQPPRVGILDIDLTGPSIPRVIGLDKHGVHQSSDGWVPV
jgi:Mrp family chromosome partitioning ATPase